MLHRGDAGPGGDERDDKDGKVAQKTGARSSTQKRHAASDSLIGTDAEVQRDREYGLSQPASEDWAKQTADVIERHYDQAALDFFLIVDDYLDQANRATRRYLELSKTHSRWRFWTILATGGLALLNACAAFDLLQIPIPTHAQVRLPAVLNVIAAIYAGALTVSGNLENFSNASEKAAGFRESRELLLNRYREYSFKWFFYVEAHGKTAKACVNAGRLYRQLIDTDCELRLKIKQLTEVLGRSTADRNAKPH
jgi:hypothetical protein